MATRLELFVSKAWGALRAATNLDDPESRFLHLWCQLEQGQTDAAVQSLRRVLEVALEDWALHRHWGLWAFRQRFGASALIGWAVHERVIGELWRLSVNAMPAAPFRMLELVGRGDFRGEWIGVELHSFLSALSAEGRPAAPWQLGGSSPLIEKNADLAMRVWARETAATLCPLDAYAERALDALRRRSDADLRALPAARGGLGDAYDVFAALARRAPLAEVTHALGTVAQHQLPLDAQRALAQRLDSELLLHDVRARLPAEAAKLERVLFRATPRRVLEVAVVKLQGRRLGVLARHVVKKGKVDRPGFSWTEGAGDEAVAAVPDEFFAQAVKVIHASR